MTNSTTSGKEPKPTNKEIERIIKELTKYSCSSK